MNPQDGPRKTALIAAVQLPDVDDLAHQASVVELDRLLRTLGYDVVGVVSQRRRKLSGATVFGAGKLKAIALYTGGPGSVPKPGPADKGGEAAEAEDEDPFEGVDAADLVPPTPEGWPHADVVVVDNEITARQARNLELATDAEVLDRTGVIVEIFHRHAQTREARLQVELARLTYVVPRLRAGVRGHDRQRGGVGGRGAGESALELDRRKVRDRIAQLRAELAELEQAEDTRRARRRGQRRVALVGYTNAGKSSLMRALTGSAVLVEDKLFATLGTTVRALQPEATPRILVSDTVGFIDKLPHDLVASFRSTLDEALEASLLLFVVDVSDPNHRKQLEVTQQVLGEIGAGDVPSRLVLNKIDRVDEFRRRSLEREYPDAIQLSAHDPADVARLRDLIVAFFEAGLEPVEVFVPYSKGAVVGAVRSTLSVVSEAYDEHGARFVVKAPPEALERVRALLR
ncbi:MAG: GTPase HflX [Myxococcales bacterium]|nr:GTPase HflX [Myxococcales bacterium]